MSDHMHEVEMFFTPPLIPQFVRIQSSALQMNHLLANIVPVTKNNHAPQTLNIERVLELSDCPYFDDLVAHTRDFSHEWTFTL